MSKSERESQRRRSDMRCSGSPCNLNFIDPATELNIHNASYIFILGGSRVADPSHGTDDCS